MEDEPARQTEEKFESFLSWNIFLILPQLLPTTLLQRLWDAPRPQMHLSWIVDFSVNLPKKPREILEGRASVVLIVDFLGPHKADALVGTHVKYEQMYDEKAWNQQKGM